MTRYTYLLLLLFASYSCITSKTYSVEGDKMRDPTAGTYIMTTTGEKIMGKNISFPSAFVLNANYIKLDGKKYENAHLAAYQDKDGYHKLFKRKEGGDVWVKQIKRGAINLYTYETKPLPNYGGTNAEYHDHFVFEKESAGIPLAELALPDIASILKDNQKAYDVFIAQFGTEDKKFLPKQLDKHPQVIMKAVDIYNGKK